MNLFSGDYCAFSTFKRELNTQKVGVFVILAKLGSSIHFLQEAYLKQLA